MKLLFHIYFRLFSKKKIHKLWKRHTAHCAIIFSFYLKLCETCLKNDKSVYHFSFDVFIKWMDFKVETEETIHLVCRFGYCASAAEEKKSKVRERQKEIKMKKRQSELMSLTPSGSCDVINIEKANVLSKRCKISQFRCFIANVSIPPEPWSSYIMHTMCYFSTILFLDRIFLLLI